MSKNSSWRSAAAILALATAAILQACGSSDNTTTTTVSIALALSSPSASVQQGGSTIVTGTVTRMDFTGTVTVTAEGAPAGVTGAVVPSGDAATVTITVAGTAVVGVYPLTIRAHGTGLTTDATQTFTLTITAAPATSFTLLAAPTSLSVAQGATNATGGVKATRTDGFAGTITYSLAGAPTGVTAVFTATATTDSLQVSVTATGAVAVGTYPVLIHGISGTIDVTTPLSIVVTAASVGGSVRLDFSGCQAGSRPIWLAFQDGTGAWTQVTGTGDVYTFNVASSKAAIATVTQSGATVTTSVTYFSQAELVANTGGCTAAAVTKSVNGSVAGLNTGDAARITLGGSSANVLTNTTFTLPSVLGGTFDLVGYRRNAVTPGVNDRGLIRRDQDIAGGGTLAVADFTSGTESFAAATANVTVAGGGAGDEIVQSMSYFAGASCTSNPFYSVVGSTATTFAMFGVPAASQRATDFHSLTLSDITGLTAFRSVTVNFHTMADRTIAFGALPVPTVTNVTGGLTYKRLQAALTLSADYTTAVFSYTDTPGNTVSVIQSAGYLAGNTAVTLTFPDLTGAAGLVTTWFPASAAAVTYSVSGLAIPLTACMEGATTRFASTTGTM